MTDDNDERRRAERALVNAEFIALSATTFISDLSELGVFIQSSRLAPIGTVLDLNFTVLLDDPIVLRGRGRVVRHQEDPPGMGIEFIDPSPELVLRLADVVTRQRPRELGPPVGGLADEDVTKHRAPVPDAVTDDFDSQKTRLYPSVRIQVQDPTDLEPPLDAEVDPAGLELIAGQSMQNMSLAEVSLAGRTQEIRAEEIEDLDEDPAALSGSHNVPTLDLKPVEVEIVDDDDLEDEGDKP